MNAFNILYGFTRTYCEITHKPISADDVRTEFLSLVPEFTDFKPMGTIFKQLLKDGVISKHMVKQSEITSRRGGLQWTYISITYRKRQQTNRINKQPKLF